MPPLLDTASDLRAQQDQSRGVVASFFSATNIFFFGCCGVDAGWGRLRWNKPSLAPVGGGGWGRLRWNCAFIILIVCLRILR